VAGDPKAVRRNGNRHMMLPERLEGHGIRLRNYGLGSHKTTCPRCSAQRRNSSDPCLSVSIDDAGAVWNCHHCAWAGGVRDAKERPKRTPRRERPLELKPPSPEAIAWFASRGICERTLQRAGVGVARRWIVDREVDCIAFPYRRNRQIVNAKFRPMDRKAFAQMPGGEQRFYLGEMCDRSLSDTAIIVEGEVDALSLLEAGIDNVVSVPDGAPAKRLNGSGDKKFQFLRDEAEVLGRFATIVLAVDNDGPGEVLRDELLKRLGRERCRIVRWPDGCKDANAVLMKHGSERLARCIDEAVADHPAESLDKRLGIVDAVDLLEMEFAPLRWIVHPYIVEGVTILAGRPKMGKSWLSLAFALGVTCGQAPLQENGATIEAGEVLYLGLEDNNRRLQRRVNAVTQSGELKRGLSFVTKWRRFDDGGLDDLRQWLKAHKRARLVVVDTLQKVRAPTPRGSDPYEVDYRLIGALKDIADEFQVAILIVHHTRKADASDFIDAVSGSSGLTGGSDTILVLKKRERGDNVGTLKGAGRDVEDVDDALGFDSSTGRWVRIGSGDEYRQGEERREVIAFLRINGLSSLSQIADGIGKAKNTTHYLLAKLVEDGLVVNCTRGKYGLRKGHGK
jgi:hypothetical protein